MLIPTVGDIHSIHSSEMSGRSCVAELQDFLVELGVFSSRDIPAEGDSIPCHSWKPNHPIRTCGFDGILYM